jgi:hypothetical protein
MEYMEMELNDDINTNYPVSRTSISRSYPSATEVRKMTNAVCDAKREEITRKIKSEIFDLILKAANLGEYKVEIEPTGNTSELFKLINQSHIEDELHKLGYLTNYGRKSSYGDSMFIIRWDKATECDDNEDFAYKR